MSAAVRDFERIYLGGKNGPLANGKFKVSEVGIGWKNQLTGQIITVSAADIDRINWVRVARDYELRIVKKGGSVLKFDGFPKESFEGLSSLISQFYSKHLVPTEISTRGYNWGLAEFQGSNMTFSVHGKQAFEIPLSDVATTQVSGKSEVSIDFALPRHDRKERVPEDFLVEIRFFVPGGVTEGMIKDGDGDEKVLRDRVDGQNDAMDLDEEESGMEKGEISQKIALDDKGDALTAAALFCETIKQKSDANAALSELIVSFSELLCVTPRGRYQVDMHADHFRLRGKTHDYKILYNSVNRLALVPRPDEMHWNFVVGIHPPLRQGQTRYPFLIFQFERENEIELSLNLEESVLAEQYEGKLEKNYDGLAYQTVSDIFSGLVGKRVQTPSSTYRSAQGYHGIKCFHKATEAYLHPLEKSFLAISKPPIYFGFSEISAVTFSRVSSTTSTKTFELKFNLVSGQEYVFSSIPREEHPPLEQFCRSKKLSIHSEIEEVVNTDDRRNRGPTGGYLDDLEGSESEDDDFVAKEESDVDEEFDSDYSSEEEGGGGEEGGEKKKKRADSSDDEGGSGEEEDEEMQPAGEPKAKSKKTKAPVTGKSKDGEPKKKKQKKEGPKRPSSSYIYFSNAKRGQVKEKNPSLSIGDIAKELGAMWKTVSPDEKEIYENMAARDKERYERELKEFKKTGVLPASSKPSSSSAGPSSSKAVKPSSSSAPAGPSSSKAVKPSPSKKTEHKSEEYVVDSDEDDF